MYASRVRRGEASDVVVAPATQIRRQSPASRGRRRRVLSFFARPPQTTVVGQPVAMPRETLHAETLHAEGGAVAAPPEVSSVPPSVTMAARSWSVDSARRGTELHARVRLLEKRAPSAWGVKEMKGALAAGGVALPGGMRNEELRRWTKSLVDVATSRWQEAEAAAVVAAEEAEGEAEAVQAADSATVALWKEATGNVRMPPMRSVKFRTRGKTNAGSTPRPYGGLTVRVSDSDDDDDIDDDDDTLLCLSPDIHRRNTTIRATLRSKGAAYATRARSGASAAPPHTHVSSSVAATTGTDVDDLLAQLRSALVPEFAQGSLWADSVEAVGEAVGRCVYQPQARAVQW